MGTHYHQMTRGERIRLDALRRAGVSVAECARQLGFCRQTIYNELRRGKCDVVRECHGYYRDIKEYSADKGQQLHERNQTAKGRPLKIGNDRIYADFLEKKMLGVQETGKTDRRKRYSPAAALAAARAEGFQTSISVNTLYSYIDKGVFLRLTNKDLWQKGRKKHHKNGKSGLRIRSCKTRKAPGRKFQRDSCRGASPNRRYPCQGAAKLPPAFSYFIPLLTVHFQKGGRPHEPQAQAVVPPHDMDRPSCHRKAV